MELLVVGSINVDLTAAVARLPGAGETVGGGRLTRGAGGKGANQAVAATRLGASVRMVGAVGDDADGRWSVENLAAAGVDVSAVAVVDAPTGVALIGVDAAGENQIIVCPGANSAVTAVAADVPVLTQLEIPLAVVSALAAQVTGLLVVNTAPALPLPADVVARADLFIANESEHALLPELHAARCVAVTYGADGAAMFRDGQESARVAGVPAEVVNTVGAGDAFCAALTLAVAQGLPDARALEAACRVGAAAVAHPASQPPLEHLDAYLR